jgi:hypothetical protein
VVRTSGRPQDASWCCRSSIATPASSRAGTSATAAGNVDTGNWFTIGQDPTGLYGESGAGDIDDLGVWKRALTPLEAAGLYMAGNTSGLSFVGAPITRHKIPPGFKSQVAALFDLSIYQSEFWHRLVTILKPWIWPYAVGSTLGAVFPQVWRWQVLQR